jgi:hypothetical protein
MQKGFSVGTHRILSGALLAGWLGFAGSLVVEAAPPPATSPKTEDEESRSAAEEARRLGIKDVPRVHLNRGKDSARRQKYDAAINQYTRVIEQFGLEEACRA